MELFATLYLGFSFLIGVTYTYDHIAPKTKLLDIILSVLWSSICWPYIFWEFIKKTKE